MHTIQNRLLTKREKEVLAQLIKGQTNKAIAICLNISTETVKKHAKNIYLKLNAKNRTEASFINNQS